MTHSDTPRKNLTDRMDELTGHDETAIEDLFGYDIYDTWDALIKSVIGSDLSRKANVRVLRALLFAEKVHDGLPPKVAYEAVMSMRMSAVNDELRLPEDEEPDSPEGEQSAEAETPAGKDESDAA